MDSITFHNQFSHFLQVNEQNILRDIAALVEIPSVYDPGGPPPFGEGCRRALDAALGMGRREGFPVADYDGYCGEIILGEQPESIAMAAHLDVAAAGEGWTHPPFRLTRQGDFLVGRGTNDNKSPFVLCLYLMKFLRDAGVPRKRSVRLICGCDEESGMRDLIHFAQAAPTQPLFTLVPDAHFPLCRAEKGRFVLELSAPFPPGPLGTLATDGGDESTPSLAEAELENGERLRFQGVSTSSGGPDYAASALPKALEGILSLDSYSAAPGQRDLLSALLRLSQPPAQQGLGLDVSDSASGPLTCALGRCSIGAGRLTAAFSARWPATLDPDPLFAPLRRFLADSGFLVSTKSFLVPNCLPEDHPLVTSLTELYNQTAGKRAKAYAAPGATYTRRLELGAAYGMDDLSVGKPFGPGRGCCHQPDECQHLPSLWTGAQTYLGAILLLDRFDFSSLAGRRKNLSITNGLKF